jgi:hypothetical protein
MAKRKLRRFDEGGEVDAMEAANASAEAQDIASSMEAGPKNEESSKSEKPKARVVSKKELEASGLSLRDFLNKERGLTRREPAKPKIVEAEEAAKSYKARYTPPGSAPKQTVQKTTTKVFMPERPDTSIPGRNFKSGGSVRSASSRADGIAIRGKTRA